MNHPFLIGNKEIYSKQLQKNITFMGGPDLHTILVRKTFLQLAQGTIEGFDTTFHPWHKPTPPNPPHAYAPALPQSSWGKIDHSPGPNYENSPKK